MLFNSNRSPQARRLDLNLVECFLDATLALAGRRFGKVASSESGVTGSVSKRSISSSSSGGSGSFGRARKRLEADWFLYLLHRPNRAPSWSGERQRRSPRRKCRLGQLATTNEPQNNTAGSDNTRPRRRRRRRLAACRENEQTRSSFSQKRPPPKKKWLPGPMKVFIHSFIHWNCCVGRLRLLTK